MNPGRYLNPNCERTKPEAKWIGDHSLKRRPRELSQYHGSCGSAKPTLEPTIEGGDGSKDNTPDAVPTGNPSTDTLTRPTDTPRPSA